MGKAWKDIPEEARRALLNWYNCRKTTAQERYRLADLWFAGRFRAWKCPCCEEWVFEGRPDDWGNFQGVRQVDYTSYPVTVDSDFWLCDSCRMHKPQEPEMPDVLQYQGE